MDAQALAWLDQQDAHIAAVIRKFGWFIQYVWDCRGLDPPFAYTTGLFGFGHPELLIFGLTSCLSARVLNQIGERIRHGEELVPRRPVTVDGWSATVMPEVVPNPAQILFTACRYYGMSVPALQLIYDDRCGRFPWHDGYAAPRLQPRPGTFSALSDDEPEDFSLHQHDTITQPSTDHIPPWTSIFLS